MPWCCLYIKQAKADSKLVRSQQALVAMGIYLQVALTGVSVLGLIELFTQALHWYNMYAAACLYERELATLADAVKPV